MGNAQVAVDLQRVEWGFEVQQCAVPRPQSVQGSEFSSQATSFLIRGMGESRSVESGGRLKTPARGKSSGTDRSARSLDDDLVMYDN